MAVIPPEPPPLRGDEVPLLVRAMQRCEPLIRPFAGEVYRYASARRASATDLLSGIGSGLHGSRWNPRGLRAVYAGLDEVTTIRESFEAMRANGLPLSQATPGVFISIQVRVGLVLDLTDPAVQNLLDPPGFTVDRMVRDPWRKRLESGGMELGLTIEIGRIASEMGLQALIVPSKPNPGGKNLVIYPSFCPVGALQIVNEADLPRPAPP